MSTSIIRFNDVHMNHYEPSDSEDEYTEKEKKVLRKARTGQSKYSDSEEEVYGLEGENTEDESDIAESDIEGKENDDLPDVRAWGKRKRDFYSADYVDPDYGGYHGRDALAADLEEEEARNIQERLTKELDDEDFSLDLFHKNTVTESTKNEEVIQTDLSTLSNRDLLQHLQKSSPEYFVLIDDYKTKIHELKTSIIPIIQQHKNGKISNCEAMDFIKVIYEVTLNYCTNIHMYILLKASKVNVHAHPILKRLYQYRQLLAEMEPIYETTIRSQLHLLIEMAREIDKNKAKLAKEAKKFKNILKKLNQDEKPRRKKTDYMSSIENIELKSKELKIDAVNSPLKTKKLFEYLNKESKIKETDIKVSAEDTKRAITYQIAKNKGLMPRRKKEERNPRVKHRNKYRKAKIRRKGAVREIRTEIARYSGEMSGIKASVSKSIKIK